MVNKKMGKQDTTKNDLEEELNIDVASEDGIEDILDTILDQNMGSMTELVAERFGTYIEPEIIEALADAYEIDLEGDQEKAVRALYSTYMKEYG
jgi:hypothetical protein